jgi:hypothetical protein
VDRNLTFCQHPFRYSGFEYSYALGNALHSLPCGLELEDAALVEKFVPFSAQLKSDKICFDDNPMFCSRSLKILHITFLVDNLMLE